MNEILKGELVRLSAVDPEEFGKASSRWSRDSEFMRFLDSYPSTMPSQKNLQNMFKQEVDEQKVYRHWFTVRALADDTLLGDTNLYIFNWPGRDAFVGLRIGERNFWGKGYGTDVMKIMLRYAFTEVNLQRVTLFVFEYNPRAIRAYEKAGFRHEGRMRQVLNREGRRWDMIFMGILHDEWMTLQEKERTNIQ